MKNTKNALLLIFLLSTTLIFAQWAIDEGFESGTIPAGWTTYNADGDSYCWVAYQSSQDAHSGDWMAMTQCYNSGGNDWLITPQVTIQDGDSFSFFARAWYSTEDMNVLLSTTGNAINDFDVTLGSITGLGASYVEFSYNLSTYAGQDIYLAIEWLQDTYAMVVDDVKVGQEASLSAPINVQISNDGIYVKINWDAVTGASAYKVYSSIDPNGTFTEDTTGSFTGLRWVTANPAVDTFYYVTAYSADRKTDKEMPK
ncbi:MAG: choice-of-anchor J domain-containing protein [Candidatus Cloacimonetes bacterium]|nr:choice-of-anchor J domain-containing protein [Candidatus Cloacimonadota bacterium]